MGRRLRYMIVAAAVLLAACGRPARLDREAELSATIVALEATIAARPSDAPREPTPQPAATASDVEPPTAAPVAAQPTEVAGAGDPPPEATAVTEATVESSRATGGAVVTTIMQELNLAGEPFAVEGDPNAPLTIVEFSDYG